MMFTLLISGMLVPETILEKKYFKNQLYSACSAGHRVLVYSGRLHSCFRLVLLVSLMSVLVIYLSLRCRYRRRAGDGGRQL